MKGLWIIEPSEARCARLSMPVCAACHSASYRTVYSCCVFACIDRQASLDEDALEVLAIKEAQERPGHGTRGRGGRKAQQGARFAEVSRRFCGGFAGFCGVSRRFGEVWRGCARFRLSSTAWYREVSRGFALLSRGVAGTDRLHTVYETCESACVWQSQVHGGHAPTCPCFARSNARGAGRREE